MQYIVSPGSSENLAGGSRTYCFSGIDAGRGDEGCGEGRALEGYTVSRTGGVGGVRGDVGRTYEEGLFVVKGGMIGEEGVTERGYGGGVRVRGGIMRGDEDKDAGKDRGEEGRGSA